VSLVLVKILRKLGLLPFLSLTAECHPYGKPMRVPIQGGLGAEHLSLHEPWMFDVLSRLLAGDSAVLIDVGVNMGQTLICAKSAAPDCAYFGFEPNPVCLNYTDRLIRENRFANTHLIPAAVSNRNGLAKLNFYSDSAVDASASLIENFREGAVSSRHIATCTAQDFTTLFPAVKVSVLKIDTEGAEWEVLESFRTLLAANRPFVILEILPTYDAGNSDRITRQNAIQALFRDFTYDLYRVRRGATGELERLEQILEIEIHSDTALSDYIAVPREKRDQAAACFQIQPATASRVGALSQP
jgi:FkbM family methyltransferase